MIRTSTYGAAGFVLAAFAGTAHAEGTASGGFQLSASVPEVCEIATESAVLTEPAGSTTVRVLEMCNAMRGFHIVASHRPLLEDELVQLDYAGQVSALDMSGLSSLAFRTGPAMREIPVHIQSEGLRSGIVISLGLMVL